MHVTFMTHGSLFINLGYFPVFIKQKLSLFHPIFKYIKFFFVPKFNISYFRLPYLSRIDSKKVMRLITIKSKLFLEIFIQGFMSISNL